MGIFSLFPFFLLSVSLHIFLILPSNANVANITNAPPPAPPSAAAAAAAAAAGPRITEFKPGIAVIVGVLTTLFSITFLLLLYVKHCKRTTYDNTYRGGYPVSRRNSGIERKVIESLPMFRFSSLTGQKDGLECAVCLNRFDADEVLRLLPKCKHAFHVECVDTWLDAHSTCPLCRCRVDPEDVLLVDYNHRHSTDHHATPRNSDHGTISREYGNVSRVSGRHSFAGERGGSLEIIAENPGRVSLDSWKSRRKTGVLKGGDEPGKDGGLAGNPGRKSKASRKDGQLPLVLGDKHRLEHRIIISGGGEAVGEEAAEEGRWRRWSDVQAADLLYLRWEMVMGGSGNGSGVIEGRSVSEITGMSRYRGNNGEEREWREKREEEGVVKRWLAWISQSQHQPAVHTAASATSSIVV